MIVKRYHAIGYSPFSNQFLGFGVFESPEEAHCRAYEMAKSIAESTGHDVKYGLLEIISISTSVNRLCTSQAKYVWEAPGEELKNRASQLEEERMRVETLEKSK